MSGSRKPNSVNHNEQPFWKTPDELQAIESQLRLLEPRTDRLDRERLIFLAGKASVKAAELPTARWAWPASLAAMTALAATLLIMLLNAPAPPDSPLPEKSFFEIRQDFAQHHTSQQGPQGIGTATLFHEEGLESLLHGKHVLVASNDIQALSSEGSPLRHAILTSRSWKKLIDASTPAN